ncbi:MAG: formyltransferase family protein [Vampirovibrionales bacterium]|nr:formyltransferase family protein [Vampirovibrionales bacterium]
MWQTPQPANNALPNAVRSELAPTPTLDFFLLGGGALAAQLLIGLQEPRCSSSGTAANLPNTRVVGLMTWPDPKVPNLKHPEAHEAFLAQLHRGTDTLPKLETCSVNSAAFIARLKALDPDVMLIAAWRETLSAQTLAQLSASGIRVVNCHPSYLPLLRGPSPYIAAIWRGFKHTGVSFHGVTPELDAGPVIVQEPVPVLLTDTGGTLQTRCAQTAKALLPGLIAKLTDPDFTPAPQAIADLQTHPFCAEALGCPKTQKAQDSPEAIGGWAAHLTPIDLQLNIQQTPAEVLYNQIRAIHPWGMCQASLADKHQEPQNRLLGLISANPPLALTSQLTQILTSSKIPLEPGYCVELPESAGINAPLAVVCTGINGTRCLLPITQFKLERQNTRLFSSLLGPWWPVNARRSAIIGKRLI